MKVYVVSWTDYCGLGTNKVFAKKESADKYANDLDKTEEGYFDHFVEEHEVIED